MKLEFHRIEIHSFMSFEDEVFDFSSFQGMTLVCGKNNDIPNSRNGSGKSTLFNSLLYALFGQLQGKIRNENLFNRFASDKDLRVALTLRSDGRQYRIVRGLNKGKTSYLEVWAGEDNATKSSIQETQSFIEKEITGCDISIFLRTILLSSDQNYNFYALKKNDKKDFVEKLFDISVFGDMYQAMHKDVLAYDKDILARQNRLVVLNRAKDDYSARSSRYDSEKAGRLKSLNESIVSAEKKYSDAKTSAESENRDESEKLKAAAEKVRTAKDGLQKELAAAVSRRGQIEIARHKIASSKETKQAVIDRHSEIMGKLCDDCRPVFSGYYKLDQYEKDIAALDAKDAELAAADMECAEKASMTAAKVKDLETRLAVADRKIAESAEKFNRASRELAAMESKISSMKGDLARISAEKNPFLEMLDQNAASVAEEAKALDEISAKYRCLKFAEGVVSQDTLRKFIIADLIALLNNRIKTYLTRLGSKYTVVFDSDMEYDFVTEGGSCEFQNFSAGERMRIMVATSFAFRDFMSIRNGLSSNVLVLDEYFDSAIDATCVESILAILREYASSAGLGVFCISHRSEVSPETFDNVICVEKTDNISRVVVQDNR